MHQRPNPIQVFFQREMARVEKMERFIRHHILSSHRLWFDSSKQRRKSFRHRRMGQDRVTQGHVGQGEGRAHAQARRLP